MTKISQEFFKKIIFLDFSRRRRRLQSKAVIDTLDAERGWE
jgi:hypothetical protein